MSIARNRMIDNARRNSRRFNSEVLVEELPAHAADDNAGEPASEYINAKALQHAIAGLPPGQRRALELIKFRETSLKEASALTGMSIGRSKCRSTGRSRRCVDRSICAQCPLLSTAPGIAFSRTRS
jgi:RNA polymerase sigma-70 factor (ECF subfamily)